MLVHCGNNGRQARGDFADPSARQHRVITGLRHPSTKGTPLPTVCNKVSRNQHARCGNFQKVSEVAPSSATEGPPPALLGP
jgi:hypothetical protein